MGVGEKEGNISGQGQGGVPGHLDALVPGDRLEEVRGHAGHRVDDPAADRGRVAAVRQRNRDKVPGLALDQRAHPGLALLSYDKIALPVAGHLAAPALAWPPPDRL